MDDLKWYFEILDQISGPTRHMQEALTLLDGRLRAVERGMRTVQGATRETGGVINDLGHAAQFAQTAWAAFLGVARTALGLAAGAAAFLLASAQFRENTLTGLRTILGTQRAAGAVFAESQRVAQLTPFDTRDVISQRTGLILAGFTQRASLVIQAAASDVGAALGQDRMQPFIHAVTRIQNEGRLTGEALEALSTAGVSRRDLFARIATRLNIREANPQRMMRAVQLAVQHGRVTSDMALNMIVDTVERNISHGHAGAFSVGQSGTLSGIISNLQSAMSDLVEGLAIEDLPGMQMFKGALQNLLSIVAPTSAGGQRLKSVFAAVINTVGGLFASLNGPDGLATIQSTFGRVAAAVALVAHGIQVVWPYFRALGGGLFRGLASSLAPLLRSLGIMLSRGGSPNAELIKSFEALGRFIGFGVGKLLTFIVTSQMFVAGVVGAVTVAYATLVGFVDRFLDIGARIGDGIATGLRNAIPNLISAGAEAVTGLVASVRAQLGIHSPSRVFAELGDFTMRGFAEGVEGGRPRVSRTLENAIAAPASRSGRSARPSVNVEVNVQVNAGGHDPDAVGREVAQQTASALANILEQLGLELGVT